MRKLDKDGDGEVTEVEFFTYMVVKLGKCDKKRWQVCAPNLPTSTSLERLHHAGGS